MIDGVFEPQQGDDETVRFREAVLTDADVPWVQARVRQRVLRWFARQGYLDKEDAKDMAEWGSGGGFSLDASVRIQAADRAGLERLLRYCARPPFALERLETIDAQRLIYHLPKAQPDGCTELILTPLELIDRLVALIPPPHTHRHRYHGVLAPNATLRAAVTALAREALNDAQQQTNQEKKDTVDAVWRSPARYLWAMLLARIYELSPLTCPHCGAEMRIIGFVTDGISIRRILEHIGEPAQPPPVAPARPCAAQSCFACVPAQAFHGLGVHCSIAAHPPASEERSEPVALLDSIAQPEPDFQFDQTLSW